MSGIVKVELIKSIGLDNYKKVSETSNIRDRKLGLDKETIYKIKMSVESVAENFCLCNSSKQKGIPLHLYFFDWEECKKVSEELHHLLPFIHCYCFNQRLVIQELAKGKWVPRQKVYANNQLHISSFWEVDGVHFNYACSELYKLDKKGDKADKIKIKQLEFICKNLGEDEVVVTSGQKIRSLGKLSDIKEVKLPTGDIRIVYEALLSV